MRSLLKRSIKRRDLLKYFGASLAGPAFKNLFKYKKSAVEHLVSFVIPPEGVVPGLPNWYSSVCRQCAAGCGIQVKILEGRAKKIEGNPDFPVNYGSLCARGQAGLQVLYNPDRIKSPQLKVNGKFEKISWSRALSIASRRLNDIKAQEGKDSIHFLTEPLRGSLGRLFSTFAAGFDANVFSYDFANDAGLIEANLRSFGEERFANYDIANSDYILSLGADFLDTWSSPVKHSKAFGTLRDGDVGKEGGRGRLIHLEPRLSVTGSSADVWLPIKPGTEGILALAIANVIIDEKLYDKSIDIDRAEWKKALKNYTLKKANAESGVPKAEIVKIARDFMGHHTPLALCGGQATAQVHGTSNAIAANILNFLAGNIGKKGGVLFNAPSPLDNDIEKSITYKGLAELSDKMAAVEVAALFVYNVNPVFNMPQAVRFDENLKNVGFIVSFSSFMDETTAMADLILPSHTYLESWGDFVPLVDGGRQAVGLMQPVVEPIFDTRPVGDVLLSLSKIVSGLAVSLPQKKYFDFLKDSWKALYESVRTSNQVEESFELFWEKSVQRGGWWAAQGSQVELTVAPEPTNVPSSLSVEPVASEDFEFKLWLYPSIANYDGRTANLPWLQQLPEPLITAAWGTWAEINPETADEMGIIEGDLVEIESPDGKIVVPAYLYYGIEPKTIAVPIGQGHTEYGRYAKDRGANPLKILAKTEDNMSGDLGWAITKVKVTKINENTQLIKTEPRLDLPGMEDGLRELDRHIVQWISPEEAEGLGGKLLEPVKALPSRDLRRGPHFLSGIGLGKYRKSQFHDYKYRWGMVIDLDKCTGCSACMVSCYAENNMPLVNSTEMAKYRHKNWIRIDRYWEGEWPKIRAKIMPVNCYQCGNAPCESVCPVYAAFHTEDGLNGQVYQRCIGTRYCNVNCPYRSRLFNWYNPTWPKPLDEQLSPEVSIRTAGIADKCSFCVQRIRFAKGIAKDEDRRVKDGEITPACAQTCPTGAITFGDLLDPKTRVSRLTRDPRRFRVFEELLNTEPAVIYLKAIRDGVKHSVPEGHGDETEEHGAETEEHESIETETHSTTATESLETTETENNGVEVQPQEEVIHE